MQADGDLDTAAGMKLLLRMFAAVHAVLALLFVAIALLLLAVAGRTAWEAVAQGLQSSSGVTLIEAMGLVAAMVAAVGVLLAAWGCFVRLNRSAEELEPEAMRQAKEEDRKLE